MKTKLEKLTSEIFTRYPDIPPFKIAQAVVYANPDTFTDVEVAEMITTDDLRRNQEFWNKVNFFLRGYPNYKNKTKN